MNYDSKNHLTTDTACNDIIDSPGINMCITDGENQNMSPAGKTPPVISILIWTPQSL